MVRGAQNALGGTGPLEIHRTIGPFGLEKASKSTVSNHHPTPPQPPAAHDSATQCSPAAASRDSCNCCRLFWPAWPRRLQGWAVWVSASPLGVNHLLCTLASLESSGADTNHPRPSSAPAECSPQPLVSAVLVRAWHSSGQLQSLRAQRTAAAQSLRRSSAGTGQDCSTASLLSQRDSLGSSGFS